MSVHVDIDEFIFIFVFIVINFINEFIVLIYFNVLMNI